MPFVFLVDEDIDFARVGRINLLETNQFEVDIVHDCTTALDMIKKRKLSLVALGLMIPEKSGRWLYQEMTNDPDLAGIPVIILSVIVEITGYHFPSSRDASGLISRWKPVSPDVLIGAIHAELLSLAWELARSMKGEIVAASSLGGRSAFRLTFPNRPV